MFELNLKNLMIATGVAVAVTATVAGVVMWCTNSKWDEKHAEKAYDSMLDAYHAAVAECPGDHNKASFAFELAASEIRKTFAEANSKFEDELKEFLERYDEQVKRLKKDIRKA